MRKSSQTIALLAIALLVLTVAGCGTPDEITTTGPPAPEQTTTTAIPPDDGLALEYEVYSALIESMFNNSLIVIEDTTADPESGLFSPRDAVRTMRGQWHELGDDILSDFQTKNESPSALERRFTLNADYVLISQQELESIFLKNGNGWDDFYAKYPGSQGILTLSRVGFNEAGDTAVLYAGNQSHWVAGEGNVVLMKKTATGWTLKGNAMMWIS